MNKLSIIALLLVGAVAACSPADKSASKPSAYSEALSQEAAKNLAAANTFLAENKSKPGIITTKSGLQYQIITEGNKNSPKPKYESIVRVNYEGSLMDGTVFDSSYKRGVAAEFPVNQLVPAWVEVLQLMNEGEEVILWAHPDIAYGPVGLPMGCGVDIPCEIPANSLLKFKMRLENVVGSDKGKGDDDITSADKITDNAVKGEGH